MRHAGVGVDDLGGAVGVLGIDLGGDQHRRVAECPRVEDRGDLADDALDEQALGAGLDLVHRQFRLTSDGGERLGIEREARLQEIHQPLVVGVERHRRAVAAGADLGPGRPEWRVRAAQSQAAASFA